MNKNLKMYQICPSCKYNGGNEEFIECPKCGIIISKYLLFQDKKNKNIKEDLRKAQPVTGKEKEIEKQIKIEIFNNTESKNELFEINKFGNGNPNHCAVCGEDGFHSRIIYSRHIDTFHHLECKPCLDIKSISSVLSHEFSNGNPNRCAVCGEDGFHSKIVYTKNTDTFHHRECNPCLENKLIGNSIKSTFKEYVNEIDDRDKIGVSIYALICTVLFFVDGNSWRAFHNANFLTSISLYISILFSTVYFIYKFFKYANISDKKSNIFMSIFSIIFLLKFLTSVGDFGFREFEHNHPLILYVFLPICSFCLCIPILAIVDFFNDGNVNNHQVIPRVPESQSNNSPVACPQCGSTQIAIGNRGFGAGNAFYGASFLGPVGLLGGLLGSGNTQVTCLKCGRKWVPGKK